MPIDRPAELRINAWDGDESPTASLSADVAAFAAPRGVLGVRYLGPPPIADPRDWRHSDVGWGLVLPDDDAVPAADKARGADAPEPIQRLLADRAGAPVLRYRPDLRQMNLRRYYENGAWTDLSVAAPDRGVGYGQIPQYLLIYGSPKAIPWAIQYALNLSAYVGRLDLTVEEGLDNYIEALITDWGAAGGADPTKPVIWSPDWGLPDITFLMARAIGEKLQAKFAGDQGMSSRWLTRDAATCDSLAAAFGETSPGFICTTSHGMTGPLNDPAATCAQLGAPVDNLRRPLDSEGLNAWSPAGAIWYAQACCSAGSDVATRYAGLIAPNEGAGPLLRAVAAAAGACVAPLPRRLLGRPSPLRAFVGHVEPTFDWTLREPYTKQILAHTVTTCLYNRLYATNPRAPIGWALAPIFAESGAFFGAGQPPPDLDERESLDIYRRLVAMDRQTLAILGDPTVSLDLGAS